MHRLSFHFSLAVMILFGACSDSSIDREALVKRHIPVVSEVDTLSPFTVGNGEFAFTVDVTGLQTFPELYEEGIHLGTQTQWGWHSVPNDNDYRLEDTFEYFDTYGRQVAYASRQRSDAGEWLRSNPHRLHLGTIGFEIVNSSQDKVQPSDLHAIEQTANIWEGIISSRFRIEGHPVAVETACHPREDLIAARIESDYLGSGNVAIKLDFPYGSLLWGSSADWENGEKHQSRIVSRSENSIGIERRLDANTYFVKLQWKGNAELIQRSDHSFRLAIKGGAQFEFVCSFSKGIPTAPLPSAGTVLDLSRKHWKEFWQTGGAVDLAGSKDPRAPELERRIVLSRYLTAVQCSGSLPPQETGLTMNSWFGKFHLEMHWWHAVHFALWGKPALLEKSLDWYEQILPVAKQKASRQGYEGARWPKMVGYDGRESPSSVGVFLIWQQPHPIYYSELLYRVKGSRKVLDRYQNLVFESAKFLASYAHWDEENGRYVLGPPLIPAQEIYPPGSTMNPTFELSYWKYGLRTAQEWRQRLGLDRIPEWDRVLEKLSLLPIQDQLYQNAETALGTFEDARHRNDHPTVVGALGMLPNDSIDPEIMRNTLEEVMRSWNWERTWGWDYPLVAMTAARVGRPEIAVDALLMEVQKNTYLTNGHNYQSDRLPIYLPGNGGLLAAVAMMAAGWDGAPETHAPGFPRNGDWVVKHEGLHPLP